MLRVLLIAEAANPEWTSVPLEGWSHSVALQRICQAHIVTQIRNESAFQRAGMNTEDYTVIDSEAVARIGWRLARFFRGGQNKGWTTAMALNAFAYPYFERIVWRQFKDRLKSKQFDLVHRITPLSPTTPSSLANKLRRIGVPFVLGPLNGGLPWPKEFDSARRKEKEWLSYVRGAYKLLPGYRSTRKNASAIICGSRATFEQMPEWCKDRCVYIPENAIDPTRFPMPSLRSPGTPLRIAFVGRLVPYKGADMLLEASAPFIRSGQVEIDVIGDGPEMPRLNEFVKQEGLLGGAHFAGWIPHQELHSRLSNADVFGFPSVREFGGAVVVEAMALGLVPIVVQYGGPGEIVTSQTGFSIPLGDRGSIILRLREKLQHIVEHPEILEPLRDAGRARAMQYFTWDAKAQQVMEVYRWVLGERDKPTWPGGEVS